MSNPRPLPVDAQRSLWLYQLAFPLVFVLLLPGYLVRLIRRGNYRPHFGQRLGYYTKIESGELAQHRWTWIQSISVGETLLALKLARELRRIDPEIHVVISTTTTTGFAMAEAEAAEWLRPIYNPIDLRGVVRRVVLLLRPVRFIVIEGGVWPSLLAECYRAGLPLALANARLSPRSEARFRRFRTWVGPLLRLFDVITVPEPDDVARWGSLGVPADKLRMTGSIKFDQPPVESGRAEELRALLSSLGVGPHASIVVAGSTFPGEEALLAQCLLDLRKTHSALLLIVVPRHIERTPAILRELAALPLRVARRTAPAGGSPPDLLLVDTTGELRDWYALATVAFIGKSLEAIGGQNPAEPAALGKPVVFGPHMENFAAITQHLLAGGAARQVDSAGALTETLRLLLSDDALRLAMSAAGPSALAAHAGAGRRTAALILGAK